MGTTKTNMGSGGWYGYVLAIEGYPRLITDTSNVSAVSTAWAGTDWASETPLQGLIVKPDFEQEYNPWNDQLQVQSMTIRVAPEGGDDTFGTAVFKHAGNESRLQPFADGGNFQNEFDDAQGGLRVTTTAIGVADTAQFSATGTVYIGGECCSYTGQSAAVGNDPAYLSGVTRGKYSPFLTESSGNLGVYHPAALPQGDVHLQPVVSDSPRRWIGKKLGLWMHEITRAAETNYNSHALQLDGAADYVSLVDTSDIQAADLSDVTISSWFYLDSRDPADVKYQILSIDNASNNGFGLDVRVGAIQDGLKLLYTAGGVALRSTSYFFNGEWETGRWYHVCVVFNSGTARWYVDGALVETDTGLSYPFQWLIADTGKNYIGLDSTGAGNYFPGRLDDIRIYIGALTGDEVARDMAQDPVGLQPIRRWKFDNDYTDSVTGATETANGSPTFTTDVGWGSSNTELWDTKAQAQLLFAGTIRELRDSAGGTVILADDFRQKIRDTTLLHNQFRGTVSPGIVLLDGETIEVTETVDGTKVTGTLTIDSGGDDIAADKIADGSISVTDLINKLADWLKNGTPSWTSKIGVSIVAADTSRRTEFSAYKASSSTIILEIVAPRLVVGSLGFVETGSYSGGGLYSIWGMVEDSDELLIRAPEPPGRLLPGQENQSSFFLNAGAEGKWCDVSGSGIVAKGINMFEPPSGENWGWLLANDKDLYLVKYESDTEFSNIYKPKFGDKGAHIISLHGLSTLEASQVGIDEAGEMRVKQVVILGGSLKDVIARLLLSTGVSGTNSTTYDKLPAQLGAAIPYDVLGSTFLQSLDDLSMSTQYDNVFLMIDKPMSLEEVLMPELLLRGAYLAWKDQTYQIIRPKSPETVNADHAFTDLNKSSSLAGDDQKTVSAITGEYVRNSLKCEFNRTWTGEYVNKVEVQFSASIADLGKSLPVTIKARNSFAAASDTGDTIRQLVEEFAAYTMPMWSRPLHKIRRTVSPDFWLDCVPGQTCTVTDDHIRDPSTGTRGISGHPGLIVRHQWSPGGNGDDPYAEVTIVLADIDNAAVMSPAAKINTALADGGYASGTPGIYLLANEFSLAAEADDITHIDAGDKLRLVEIDPADPAAATQYSVTVGSTTAASQLVTLSGVIAGYDNTKEYYVFSENRNTAQTSQQADCYQADEADYRVQNSRHPYEWPEYWDGASSLSAVTLTDLPDFYADEWYGDGAPLTPIVMRSLLRYANNMISYKTAPSAPHAYAQYDGGSSYDSALSTTSTTYVCVAIRPIFFGLGGFAVNGRVRKLTLAPTVVLTDGTKTGSVRYTLSLLPPRGSSLAIRTFAPRNRVELTHTGNSGTVTTLTAEDLDIIYNQSTGMGYLMTEIKTTGGTFTVLADQETRFGPLE